MINPNGHLRTTGSAGNSLAEQRYSSSKVEWEGELAFPSFDMLSRSRLRFHYSTNGYNHIVYGADALPA
jgi:hypothetical protein